MRNLFNQFRHAHIIIRVITIISLVFLTFGIGIHLIEPDEFPTVFDGIWWVIVTTSTVGYGDYVPSSALGRTVAIILILVGAGFVTFYMITLSTTVFNLLNALKEGSATYKGEHHIIIVGWNERAKNTIHQLLLSQTELHIVLIDETINESPLTNRNVHFVKGNPTRDGTLRQANIERAEMVLVTADQHRNEHEADMQSILTLIAIKGLNPSIYCLVEILTKEQVNNAKRAGADELVETYLLASYVMVDSLHSPGLSTPIVSLLNDTHGSKLDLIPPPAELINQTFVTGVQALLKREILLIGINKGEEFFIHPSPSLLIDHNHQLLVIVH